MPSDESKGSQLDAIGSLAQRQLDNTRAGALQPAVTTSEKNTQATRLITDLF